MSLWRLTVREILHRRTGFLLGVAAVVLSVLCFTGSVALLGRFDADTEEQVGRMAAETARLLKAHEDKMRRTTKGLGFNIHIFPESQDLAEVYAKGYGSETMPQEYATKLADSEIVTVNHLLPRLTKMVEWGERGRTVLLFGVSGQVPIAFRGANKKKPIMGPVAPGEIVLGHELHQGEGLAVGDKVMFNGREFEVSKTHRQRGTVDDITVWISLEAAQEMLGQPGRINSILALECNCESVDRLGEIRGELGAILPGVKIIEVQGKALARAEVRNEAKALRAREQAEFERGREAVRATRAAMIGVLVPLVALLSMAWIAYLTFVNVGQRAREIGTLRAIGVGSGKVFGTFLMRAALMGLAGASAALLIALAAGFGDALSAAVWAALIGGVILLASAAAWVPALLAAGKDPATVLRHD